MPETETAPKRADARRNIAAILEAATACLARDPEASVAEIARAAGVGRVTLYGHFESRSVLVAAVVEAAMAHAEEALQAVDLAGNPADALARLLTASWQVTHRHGAVVQAGEKTLPADELRRAHEQPILRMRALLERGRAEGAFRTDLPLAWEVSMIQSILHGASAAVHRGDHSPDEAADLVVRSVLGALAPPAG